MTDEWPTDFDPCTARPAPAELRAKTLAAVERELARRRKPRWERAFELSVAASLVLGIGLNTWVWRAEDSRHAGFDDRTPSLAARDVAQAVASVAGPAAGRWVQDEFARAESRKRGADSSVNERYQRLLHELSQGRIPESL